MHAIIVLALLVALLAGAVFTLYLVCYGGLRGPVDWLMHTRAHRGRNGRRQVTLTFDDGPDPDHTPALLDMLARHSVRATFFVVGEDVDANPALTRRIVAEGHELGNHTYHHRYLPLASRASVVRELADTDAAVVRATGVTPRLVRPPWGGRSPWTVRTLARAAKRLVLWDVNSFDWRGEPAPIVVRRVLERARPGSIILMHEARDGGATTVEAVGLLVPALRARGYGFVTAGAALG